MNEYERDKSYDELDEGSDATTIHRSDASPYPTPKVHSYELCRPLS